MVITCGLSHFLIPIYGKSWMDPIKGFKITPDFFKPENTYIVIFNKRQEMEYNTLMSHPGIKIVYQGPPAVNKNPHHGTEPRNFIVVFEYEPVQALPEMSV